MLISINDYKFNLPLVNNLTNKKWETGTVRHAYRLTTVKPQNANVTHIENAFQYFVVFELAYFTEIHMVWFL